MSEADIKILEEFIKDYEAVTDPLEKSSYYEEVPIRSIKNLVNQHKEQEKMIELMNEYILKNCVSLEICSKQIGKECYIDVIYGDECKECVLDYFRKKAKEMK